MDAYGQNVIDIFAKIFACYSLLLVVCALVLDPLILFMCLKSKKLRSTSTFKLLAFASINDMISCFEWNQEDFFNIMFNFSASYTNIYYCRWISVFLQYTTLELASWMLVSISLDRLLSILVKKWSKQYFNGAKPIIYAFVLASLIVALNFNLGFTGGFIVNVNGTDQVFCYESDPNYFDWYDLMSQIFVYFGFMIPYGLLILINLVIIYKATQFTRAQKAAASMATQATLSIAKRKAQMTHMILFITFLYIAISLPGIIITGYLYNELYAQSYGIMVVNLFNAVQFSYPALNFFILFFSNKLFAEEVKSIIFNFKLNRVSTVMPKTNPSVLMH